jgi:Domain of unknown function (DUF2017)
MSSASGFTRHGKNSFIATFGESESEVLINLSQQLIEILAERIDGQPTDPLEAMVGFTGHDSPPDDEVLLRLLPNAYADPVDSSEFRRYTESVLREKKRLHAMAIRSHLLNSEKHQVALDQQTAQAWLGAMNDIRLALGVRLRVDSQSHEQLELLSPDDPMRGVYAVYTWLGWLQGTLVDALMNDAEG